MQKQYRMNKQLAILIIVSLSGCLSQKKLAQKCADKFPVKEEIKEIIIIDTIQSKADTILVHFKDSILPVICPPSKTITKTKEIKITAENTAKTHLLKQDHQKQINKLNDECNKQIKSLNAELEKHIKEIDKLNNKLNSVKKFKHWFWILISGIFIYFAIRLRRLFSLVVR